jgi:hypothetical protein
VLGEKLEITFIGMRILLDNAASASVVDKLAQTQTIFGKTNQVR